MANSFSNTVDKITSFIEVKIEQIKIKLIRSSSKLAGNIIGIILISVFGLLFLLFFTIGIATLINHFMGSPFWGYFIIAGFYLFMILIFLGLMNTGKISSWIESALSDIDNNE